MKSKNSVISIICTHVIFILFFSMALFSQEQKKLSSENEKTDKNFKTIKEVWTTPFKSQGKTGTCWCFSTTSFLESEAHRLGRGDFEISQMYTVYYAYIEKALRTIRTHAENPFREGGLSHDVIYLMGKYGAVPRSNYIGIKDAENKYDHREMYNALSGMLKGIFAVGKDAPIGGHWIDGQFQWYWLSGFKGVLDAYLGKLPDSIMYNGKNLTPRQFSAEVLNLPLDDYIEITSYSLFPFNSAEELLLPDNWLHYHKFYNVPLDDFMRIIDHALENGFSLCADLHLNKDEFKSKKNYALGHDEEKGVQITQNERDGMFDNWRTEDVHLEHIIGMAKDEQGKKYYKAKDSVSSEDGNSGPYYNKEYLSENFVKSRVLFIMVHKDGLPHDISVKLGTK